MKEYFLHDGMQQLGPFSLEELRTKGINSKTMVWYESLPDWTEAGKLDELKDILSKAPPPFTKPRTTPPPFEKAKKLLDKDYIDVIENKIPNKSGKRIFQIGLIIFAVIGIVFVFLYFLPNTERRERNNPMKYLSLSDEKAEIPSESYYYASDNRGQIRVIGKIHNSATKTQYKDFQIEISFESKTHSKIGSVIDTIYDAIGPNSDLEIGKWIKTKVPDNTEAIGWELKNAKALSIE